MEFYLNWFPMCWRWIHRLMVCFAVTCLHVTMVTSPGDFTKMYKTVIDIFCCLVAVCSVELIAFLFSTFASLLLYFNEKKPLSSTADLQRAVLYKLCYYMFPLCLGMSLCLYMCVYMCVYVYVCVCVCVCVCVRECTCTCTIHPCACKSCWVSVLCF